MSSEHPGQGAHAGSARRIMVAGVGGGIGGACAARLRHEGHAVVGVDRDGRGSVAPDLTADLTAPGVAEEAVGAAEERLGGLDGLVHAIGMSGRRLGDGPVTACTDTGWHEVLRVNLESAFRLLRAGLPVLRGGEEGAAVLIGSTLASSTDSDFLTAAYAASKGGLVALARVAAREVAADGVRVNVVAPGLVRTPMAERAASDPHIQERLRDLQPLAGEMLAPEDVAEAVAWLLSPASRQITGTVVPVDGGWWL